MDHDEAKARRIDVAVGAVETLERCGAETPPGGWPCHPGFAAGLEAACAAADRLADAGCERPGAGGWMAHPEVAAAWADAVAGHALREDGP